MPMKAIAILGSAALANDSYADTAEELGQALAQKDGTRVVIPGELDGIKGAFASGMAAQIDSEERPRQMVNVYADPGAAPHQPHTQSAADDLVSNKSIVDGNAGVRRSLMNRADMAVLLPGGIEDMDQAVHMARRGKPLVVLNQDAYYDGFHEQVQAYKANSLTHNFEGNEAQHIHFVEDVRDALNVIEAYNTAGTPEYNAARRWEQARENDKRVKPERDSQIPGYSARQGGHILAKGGGLAALNRATRTLSEEGNVRLLVDNEDGYHNGLLQQLRHFVEEGAEPHAVLNRISDVKDSAEANAITRYEHKRYNAENAGQETLDFE